MNYDPTDIASQEQAQKKQELQDQLGKESEEADLKWLCSTKRGRRIVWRLLDQSGVFRLSFDPNCAKMAFNEGNRNYGNTTLAKIMNVCPELFLTMTKENNGRTESDSARKTN
jgi:hypothetical protein